MKYLSDYAEEAQTKLFDELGIFFAFNQKQLEAARAEGVKYVSMGAGMICPEVNAIAAIERLDAIHTTAINRDVKDNGMHAIIMRELGNHEAQITGDIDSTMDALDGYPVTFEEVLKVYQKEYMPLCIKNDWF